MAKSPASAPTKLHEWCCEEMRSNSTDSNHETTHSSDYSHFPGARRRAEAGPQDQTIQREESRRLLHLPGQAWQEQRSRSRVSRGEGRGARIGLIVRLLHHREGIRKLLSARDLPLGRRDA